MLDVPLCRDVDTAVGQRQVGKSVGCACDLRLRKGGNAIIQRQIIHLILQQRNCFRFRLGHRKCILRGGFLRGIGCVGIGRGTVRRLYLCGERRGNHADSQHQNQKKCDTSF